MKCAATVDQRHQERPLVARCQCQSRQNHGNSARLTCACTNSRTKALIFSSGKGFWRSTAHKPRLDVSVIASNHGWSTERLRLANQAPLGRGCAVRPRAVVATRKRSRETALALLGIGTAGQSSALLTSRGRGMCDSAKTAHPLRPRSTGSADVEGCCPSPHARLRRGTMAGPFRHGGVLAARAE